MSFVDIYAIADAYVDYHYLNANFSSSLLSVNELTTYRTRTFLRFPLSIPANAIIESATLYLYEYSTGGSGVTCWIRNIPVANRTWTTSGITWNNQPAFETYPDISFVATSNGQKSIDITSYIRDQHNLGVGADFVIMSAESTGTGNAIFFSSRGGTLSTAPRIKIIYSYPSSEITAVYMTPITNCLFPCNLTVDIIWQNMGINIGTFVPAVVIDGIKTSFAPESLTGGETVLHTFSITGLTDGTHTICPDPN
jgi:hypothetical protein